MKTSLSFAFKHMFKSHYFNLHIFRPQLEGQRLEPSSLPQSNGDKVLGELHCDAIRQPVSHIQVTLQACFSSVSPITLSCKTK